jgi:hypothetical protein
MDSSQELYLANRFNLAGNKTDPEFFTGLFNALSNYSDCFWNFTSNLQNTPRMQYSLEVFDPGCAITNHCPTPICEDTSCQVEEDVCLTWCRYRSWIPSTPISQVS